MAARGYPPVEVAGSGLRGVCIGVSFLGRGGGGGTTLVGLTRETESGFSVNVDISLARVFLGEFKGDGNVDELPVPPEVSDSIRGYPWVK